MKEKRSYRVIFYILFIICFMAMIPPIFNIANQEEVVLGLPMFLTWVFSWGLLASIVLLVMYFFDSNFEKKHATK